MNATPAIGRRWDPLPLAHGGSLTLDHLLVMGVLNATPDSFSDGGELDDPAAAEERVQSMLGAGVDVLDVGGESTRPGHKAVPAEVEIGRVVPVIEMIRELDQDIPVSIDTRKASVAATALEAGASLVNDVSGLADPDMPAMVRQHGCAYVAMRSGDCDGPIVAACRHQLEDIVRRATSAGVGRSSIVVDPGLGFGARPGPSPEENLALIDGIDGYSLGRPVLIGASRKRFVGALSGEDKARRRVAGSVEMAVRAARAGAAILRVHDVEETVAALDANGLRARTRPARE